jgi:hypothetical protein
MTNKDFTSHAVYVLTSSHSFGHCASFCAFYLLQYTRIIGLAFILFTGHEGH